MLRKRQMNQFKWHTLWPAALWIFAAYTLETFNILKPEALLNLIKNRWKVKHGKKEGKSRQAFKVSPK